jgi:cytidine deaminase
MMDEGVRALIKAARTAATHAHAPYSRFAVGAAVLLSDGTVVTGTNFENASYGLSLCAETVALATANAQGRLRDVVAIGIVGGRIGHADTAPISPCGRCRQVINEAAQLSGHDLPILCAGLSGEELAEYRLSQLLPHAFGPKDLGIA